VTDVEQAARGARSDGVERRIVPVGAVVLTTFFALLYALRGGIAALDRGEDPQWARQVVLSLAAWWACIPLLPPLAWMVRTFPVGRAHPWRNGALLVLSTLAAAWLRHWLLTPVVTWVTRIPVPPASAAARTLTYFTVFLVMVALLHAVHYYRDVRARDLNAAELARALAEARLAALRAQLQPHFVFNVLNAVTALLHVDPMAADRMLTRFAALLRTVLQEGGAEEHTLARELEVLERYVELMQLRFGDRIVVEWDVAPGLDGRRVPFMVLQPLVENAYEHGLGDREAGGRLRIAASADGGPLRLEVEDDGAGLPADGGAPDGDGAIGVRNTRERLARLYGDGARLELAPRAGGGTRAVVTLPAPRPAAVPAR
jgi:signal transduction histidine kinase